MAEFAKIHFIDQGTDTIVVKRVSTFVPRVGDEVRVSDEIFYRVSLVVWVYDEPGQPLQRINVGMKKISLFGDPE